MLLRNARRWVAALCTLLLLAGCANLPGRQKEPAAVPVRTGAAPAGPGPVTLRISVDPAFPDPALDAVLTAFQDQHPQYRIERIPLPFTAPGDKVMEEKVMKGEVDLFAAQGYLGVWTNQGKTPAADLMPYAQKSHFDLDPYSPVFTELSFRGRLQELPWAVRPLLLVANRGLTQAAGVKLPDKSWTWDEFLTAARKTVRDTGDNKVWGLSTGMQTVDLTLVHVAQARQAGTKDEEAVGNALHLVADLVQDGTLDRLPKPAQGRQESTPDYFGLGRAGFTLLPLEFLYGEQAPRFDWRALPMPVIPGSKPFTPVLLSSYAIADSSPNKDAAWELLSFMAGPEGALAVARMGVMPYRLSPEGKQAYLSAHPQLPPEVAGALDTGWVTYPYYLSGQSRPALLWSATIRVMRGEKTWEAATEEYQTGVAKLQGKE